MINEHRLLRTFLDLVQIDSPSGEEAAFAQELERRFSSLGMSTKRDELNNVVARLSGQGAPVMLAAHMDTLMPGRGIKPVVKDGVVRSDGTTILGADDKAGVTVILEVLNTIVDQQVPHPPVEAVITVQEEVGLVGAKGLDKTELLAQTGISLDAGGPQGTIVVSAPSQDSIAAVIHGKAAHAGSHPEKGINAIRVAAEALCEMPLGRIDPETTANIGVIKGGTARNVVPDRVELVGEARSRELGKLEEQTARMVAALAGAADRHGARPEIQVERAYDGYTLSEGHPIVRRLADACRTVGVEPNFVPSGGGSDANIYNAHGIEVVNLSVGMDNVHTTDEYVAVADIVAAAEIVLTFVTDPCS
jgi:tripeptide aminopeptidase